MNLREAAQQALEAMGKMHARNMEDFMDSMTAYVNLQRALAEPERKPLTDEELKFIADQYGSVFGGWETDFARAVIEAHEAKQRGGEA